MHKDVCEGARKKILVILTTIQYILGSTLNQDTDINSPRGDFPGFHDYVNK